MYIQRIPPGKNWTKMDRNILAHKGLSDGAKVLYGVLFGLYSGTNYSDEYLCNLLGLSQRSVTARKKELKDADLLCTEQIGARIYHSYMGTSTLPASKVMRMIKAKDLT